MLEERIRVAIVGLGQWGSRAHLPAFASLPGVEVAAVVDQRPHVAASAARAFAVPRVESDIGQLFRDADGLDAVVLATPDDTHRDLAVAAFSSGLHVLCEKPLAYNVDQAEQMMAAAHQSGRVAKIGFLFRHSPVVARMKQLVDQGLIGDVQLFESVGVNAQFVDPQHPLHWKMQRRHANGGVFVEYGSHSIDLGIWFGGPFQRVVAHGMTLVSNRPSQGNGSGTVDVDDVASWIGVYASGGQALFRSGWASLSVGGGGMRVYGSRGTLMWQQDRRRTEALIAVTLDDPTPRTLFEFTPPFDPATDEGDFPLGLLAHYNYRLAESFVRDIRQGEVSWPSFADGLAVQHVLAAIRTSLDQARWVDIIDA